MKTLSSILIISTTVFSVQSQNLKDADVPVAVKEKLASMYPDVKGAVWEKENGKFEAEFKENNIETSVLFDAKGNFVQREDAIQTSSFPPGVMTYVAKNLSKQKVNDAQKITNAKGVITYKAEIAGTDYIFDSEGNFIRKEVVDNDSDDDEGE